MLDVMIIDDDLYIRDYLKKAIDWDDLGLQLVCEAGDSETARELFEIHRPRIIITDINIPTVSGLELAKEFTARDSNLHIIVITGYGDFENVRASVALGAVELLPKPIVPEEMHRSLQTAVTRFREKQERYRTHQLLNDLVREHRSILQIQFLTQLMNREPSCDDSHFEESLRLLELSLPDARFSVVRLEIQADDTDTLGNVTFPVAFQKLFEDKFHSGGYKVWSFFSSENRMDCLLAWSFDKPRGAIETTLTELREETEFYFHRSFRAGIGSAIANLRQLYTCAEQADIALRFQDGDVSSILHFRNVNTLSAPHRINNEKVINQLTDCIQTFRFDDFSAVLEEWLQKPEVACNVACRQEFALEFLSKISSVCYVLSVYPWQEVNYPQTISKVLAHTTPDQLKQTLLAVGEQLCNLLFKKRAQSKNQLIHLAKLYIQENISDKDLSVASVSSHIGLSNNYFSQLFHKEENVSFSSYLNMVRIEQAKLLLRDTSKKIFEISEQTGFSNPKYFNYVFKRLVGATPLDWRKKIMENI